MGKFPNGGDLQGQGWQERVSGANMLLNRRWQRGSIVPTERLAREDEIQKICTYGDI